VHYVFACVYLCVFVYMISFASDPDFSVGVVLQTLLNLRTEVNADERRTWLAPYSAELKQLAAAEEARKSAADRAAAKQQVNKFTALITNKPVAATSTPSNAISSPESNIGLDAMGLEVTIVRGTDLAVKDINTSDPYVNTLLLDGNRNRITKVGTRVIEKTVSTFHSHRTRHRTRTQYALMDRINVLRFLFMCSL
jgi:hypothetical protein